MVLIEVDDKDEDRNQLANLSESMQAEDVMLAQELGAQQIKSLTSESADALSRLNATR
jgi:primosomal protein N''